MSDPKIIEAVAFLIKVGGVALAVVVALVLLISLARWFERY